MKKIKLKVLIVEDEKQDRELLGYLLKSNPGIDEIHEAKSAEEGLFKFVDINPDIVFLDIVMPGKSGIDFIEIIKKRKLETTIIIVSSYPDAAIEAIKNQVYDFLLKPINEKELFSLVKKHQSNKDLNINEKLDQVLEDINQPLKLRLTTKNSHILVDPEDILYFAAEGAYTDIHLANGNIELSNTYLSAFEKLLEDYRFFRIGRSTLINLDKLWKVNRSENTCTLISNSNEIELRGSTRQIKLLCDMNI